MLSGLLIKNISCLVQTEDVAKLKVCGNKMPEFNTITDAFLYISEGFISDFGKMKDLQIGNILIENPRVEIINAGGRGAKLKKN